jgi:hypothetical protein
VVVVSQVPFTTGALSMPAGASSGVADVTAGSTWCEATLVVNSATGTCSAPESVASPVGLLDLPQLQGAYQEPNLTDDAVNATCEFPVAPALHPADWSGLVRQDRVGRPAVRGRDEN